MAKMARRATHVRLLRNSVSKTAREQCILRWSCDFVRQLGVPERWSPDRFHGGQSEWTDLPSQPEAGIADGVVCHL